ncbi:MAG: alpha/beta hydrolase [Gammaproteobacteria bacterium]|nr:alpha/beta hydrolase [Gammaproteobacteria bacterium]
MPAPEVHSKQNDNHQALSSDTIFYATDRKPVTDNISKTFYENARGHVLRLGVAKIKLTQGEFNQKEKNAIFRLKNRSHDYSLHVTEVNEAGLLDSTRNELYKGNLSDKIKSANKLFATMVNNKLTSSKTKDIYIYMAGYKVGFSNPLLVASEFWNFLDYDGVFISYSWPASPSRWAYAKDLETANYSSRNFRLLLEYLSKETRAHRIHIIAHSAGTRIAINSLAQLALLNSKKTKQSITNNLRIGNVILIGSDYDRDVFGGYLLDGFLKVMEKLTLYMSGTDKALGISNILFTRRRLGQIFSPKEISKAALIKLQHSSDIDVIDVTNAELAAKDNGHAYFRKSPWVSSDLLMILKYQLSPQDRGLIRHKNLPLWVFPDDYVTRLKKQLNND